MAVFATLVAVRTWLGERALAEGTIARRRGEFEAADAAYRAASGYGNAAAAIERAQLELLRRDWAGTGERLREAMALAPMRAFPHLLQATLETGKPGPWDSAREERVLVACRTATALEPARGATWSASAGAMLKLVELRRAAWDPARTRSVIAESADGFAEALARDPGAARDIFARILEAGGKSAFLFDVASRGNETASLSPLVGLLLDRGLWVDAEPGLWAAAEERGVLPAFAAAASDALARRAMLREGGAAARRGLLAAPGDGALTIIAADLSARLPGQEALEAAPLYRAAIAANPANLAVRRRFAGFLLARNLLGEAEREARAAVDADAKDAEAWYLLGEILRRDGRAGEAAAAYREAAALRPKNETYRRAAAGGQR